MSVYLVTGGGGFIGSHIVRRLLSEGRRVRVLDDFSTGRRQNLADIKNDIELLEGDICHAPTAKSACEGVDTVFHLAARTSVPRSVEAPAETNETNVTGTLRMLIAARDAGARRFVNTSSSAPYGDTPTLPKVESMAPTPLSPYAVAKLAAEFYCSCFSRLYGLSTVSLRYFNVFGPRQDPKSAYAAVIPAFVSAMVKGERPVVFGDGEQSRDFCYIDNVVDANLLAAKAERLAGEVVNVACGERTTLNEMIGLIQRELGVDIQPIYRAPRAGDVKHSLAGLNEARRLIGYTPKVLFAEGLRRSIAWYRAHVD